MSQEILFYFFAGLAIGMAALVIFQTNPVASALSLVFALFALSGLYVLLDAPFVAVLQVLVYAGAIMVLFVFVIMLLKLRPEDLKDDKVTWGKSGVVLMGVAFAFFLIKHIVAVPAEPFKEVAATFGDPKSVGYLLFTKFLIPFELTSFLLLIAMIGVVILARRGEVDSEGDTKK